MNILLASKSPTRAKLLKKAGIKFETVSHGVDEEEVKLSMSSQPPKEVAIKLSELKALKPSSSNSDVFVIGSDQVLDLQGKLFNKAHNRGEAVEQLRILSGQEHTLITSTVIAKNNSIVWRHLNESKMKMRVLSEEMIQNYLVEAGDEILNIVGVYAIEKEGIKLFESIDGDIFSIQGISMLPLTQFLWNNNILFKNDPK
jgi:septum formation protein